jgi:ORF029|nr:MAG TPA: YopX protein [Caudoviricetes sp.]
MSREIKFRVYDKEKNMWTNFKIFDNIIHFMDKNTGVWFHEKYKAKGRFSLMQYTGLKDSEGYEIYEDDIVWNEWDEEYQVVIYDDGEYKLMGESHIQNLFNNLDYIDVRGNVYENSELVKAWYKED